MLGACLPPVGTRSSGTFHRSADASVRVTVATTRRSIDTVLSLCDVMRLLDAAQIIRESMTGYTVPYYTKQFQRFGDIFCLECVPRIATLTSQLMARTRAHYARMATSGARCNAISVLGGAMCVLAGPSTCASFTPATQRMPAIS